MGTTQLETVPEPKYWHLKTVLSEALDQDFAVGEVLPNERELAARFGVARATLRQALEQLELEGRLQRRRGVGTTVAPPRVGVAVGSAQHSWPGEVVDGWEPVDAGEGLPSAAVLRLLVAGGVAGAGTAGGTGGGFAADQPVHTVRRTRVTQGQVVAAELLYVPAASVPGLTGIEAPAGPARARAVLRELQRLVLDGQDRSVELGSARADDAKELDRLPGAPVLLVTTRYFTAAGTAAVSVATYRADTCRLTFGDSGDVEITHEPRVAS
ncbi:GntR family transcriptional regulator [Streptomyces sp. NBC_00162]|uniref:GntR family transcriptional regulator n=1 Tax=Streptomyces sp. NBC_00162 TaxID=2903629 RepID=UPI00214BCC49|nr:GntR family transcriptional regulator [Streptomyces sp. NBC_00162]UUU43146.1 GntR family transcriptional regulator [Streptomyces sp. NBC_00162]